MHARSGNLKRPACAFLTTYVGELRCRRCCNRVRTGGRRGLALASQVRDGLRQVMHRDRLDPGECHLGTRLGGADQPVEPRAARPLGCDESADDRPKPPVESELAERRVPRQCARRKLPLRREHRERDRHVEC